MPGMVNGDVQMPCSSRTRRSYVSQPQHLAYVGRSSSRAARCSNRRALRCFAVLSKDVPSSTSGDGNNARDRAGQQQQARSPLPQLADPILASKLNQLLRAAPPPTTTTDERTAPMHAPVTARTQRADSATVVVSPPPSTTLQGPAAGQGTCWFFAYGSGLHKDALSDSQDVKVLSRDQAFLRDPKMQLVFRHKGGQATLMNVQGQPRPMFSPPDAHVHGVLYKVEESELRKIVAARSGYELKEVEVQTYAGCAVRSWVLVSSPMALLPREVPPTESYMRQLRDGAADQVLDPAYQAWLSSIETVSSAGLPLDYYNTPEKYATYVAVAVGAAAALALFLALL